MHGDHDSICIIQNCSIFSHITGSVPTVLSSPLLPFVCYPARACAKRREVVLCREVLSFVERLSSKNYGETNYLGPRNGLSNRFCLSVPQSVTRKKLKSRHIDPHKPSKWSQTIANSKKNPALCVPD